MAHEVAAIALNMTSGPKRTALAHRRGLYTLALVEMWERFSFYGMRALLILFLLAAPEHGGLGASPEDAGAMYGLYTAGVYLFSLPGGWLADRLIGQRKAVYLGAVLIALGNLSLGIASTAGIVYGELALIALGVGLLKPNISVMVGQLYAGESAAGRDAAFCIFYFGISTGAFIAPLIAGTMGELWGYRWAFVVAGAAMLLGLLQYHLGRANLGSVGEPVQAVRAASRNGRTAVAIVALGILLLLALLRSHVTLRASSLADMAGWAILALGVVYFAAILFDRQLSAPERRRVVLIGLLVVCSAIFVAGLEQSGSSLNIFARQYTDRTAFGSWFHSGEHPSSWYQSIEPIFVLLLSPAFAVLWLRLGRSDRNPGPLIKFALALLSLALAYQVISLAADHLQLGGGKVSPAWLVATYFFFTLGELLISPIGLSAISKLAPARYVSQLMGMWFLAAAIGNLGAGLMGGQVAAGGVQTMPQLFQTVALYAAAAAVSLLLLAVPMRRWAVSEFIEKSEGAPNAG